MAEDYPYPPPLHQRHLSTGSSISTIYSQQPPLPPHPPQQQYYHNSYYYLPPPNYYPNTPFQPTYNSNSHNTVYRTPQYHHQPPPPPPSTPHHHYPLRRTAHPKFNPPPSSPKPHWKNKHQPNSPRHGPLFPPRSPYSSTSSPSTQGPQSPSSLPMGQQPLVRGSLAQAKLRAHPSLFKPDHISFSTLSIDHSPQNKQQHQQLHAHHHHHQQQQQTTTTLSSPLARLALPKPPIHSQYALWVGNIPNDASHEELWKFFSSSNLKHEQHLPPPVLSTAGVESVHLIARSNCAFVNYSSQAHLTHAISSCNGKPLRPLEPYCKPLLCRIRKPEDNIKSGVGAQRIGGMHRSWIRRSQHPPPPHHHHLHTHHHHKSRHTLPFPSEPPKPSENPTNHTNSYNDPSTNLRTSSTLTSASNQSQSTTSSFLTNHFPRRYFILKAYTHEDLQISVERSIWVSQTHNEPVLEQAYRTSSEGVYLIFSANQSGEFFGYARMAGPIGGCGRRVSLPSSPAAERRATGRTRSASIGAADRPAEGLFGLADAPHSASPRTLSPVDSDRPPRWPSSPVRRSLPILGVRHHPPSSSPAIPTLLDHASFSPTTRPSSEHSDDSSSVTGKLMTGRPFKVDWIRVQRLAFFRTKNLRNPFNGNREVKVSRDGTEVEPSVGQAILTEIDNEFFRHNHPSS